MSQVEHFHIAIIGAGPAGLSAAGRAAWYQNIGGKADRSYVLLEGAPAIANTIVNYQKGKYVMAEPSYLDLRSDFRFSADSRESILESWQATLESNSLNIRFDSKVTEIKHEDDGFRIGLQGASPITADFVVLAIGSEGNPRRLGVPGDDLPLLQYTLADASMYENETIVVVGAGDSAIENALALSAQNQVYILNRRGEFSRAKTGNLDAILKAANDEDVSLDCYYNTVVEKVQALDVADSSGKLYKIELTTGDGQKVFPIDRIIARLGSVPARDFLEGMGIEFASDNIRSNPVMNECYESSVPGLYIIGSLAGYPLIKQGMNQGHDVVSFIHGDMIAPVESKLLEKQFRLLPFVLSVDQVTQLFQQRTPMLNEMNLLQFRELIIESQLLVCYQSEEVYQNESRRAASIAANSTGSSLANTRIMRAGEFIFRQGDFSSSFFTIIEGEIKLTLKQSGQQIAVLGRGQFFGESGLLSGQPRNCDAAAIGDCILVETPRRTMLKLMNSNDGVADGIDLIFRVRALQAKIAPNGALDELTEAGFNTKVLRFKAGDTIYKPEETGNSLYIVRSGAVVLSHINHENKNIVVGQFQSGSVFGEMALMGDLIRRHYAVASVLTEVIEVAQEEFSRLVRSDTSGIEKLQRDVSAKYVQQNTLDAQPEVGQAMQFFMDQGLGEATNALIIDENLCVSCDYCEKACAETHNGVSRLNRKAGNRYAKLHVPVSCRHCQQPHCMKDCPPDAIHRAASGEVFIDSTCIGCGNCESNCPYDVIRMEYEAPDKPPIWARLLFGYGADVGEVKGFQPDVEALAKGKKAVKCDACMSIKTGPACVSVCPTGAASRIAPNNYQTYLQER
jgi:CRP-like cAMP-binding protein/thioredoxin reductase/Fe-S-cluster-containing hydrogenase component 2